MIIEPDHKRETVLDTVLIRAQNNLFALGYWHTKGGQRFKNNLIKMRMLN